MHDSYDDIRSRIVENPVWYDIHGTPRYDQPTVPLHLLGWIRCQRCGEKFWVSLTDNIYHMAGNDKVPGYGDRNVEEDPDLVAAWTEDREGLGKVWRKEYYKEWSGSKHLRLRADWHYGDPPYHGGCIGETMNSIPEYEWEEYAQEGNWDEEICREILK